MKPIMLVILDGFGIRKEKENNAVSLAKMPNWNQWLKQYPNTTLKASGESVGLPKKYMGNSEVGHLTIGAGKTIKSILCKINESKLHNNETLINNLKTISDYNSLHIMGLISDAGVHSHINHIKTLVKIAQNNGIKNIFIHAFLDGRDTPPKSAEKFLSQLNNIASIHGRYYAMDRDNNLDRTEKSFTALTTQQISNKNWKNVISNSYEKNITDEFIEPTLLIPEGYIKYGDGVIFANFRPDRARQITNMFLSKQSPKLKFFITMTQYQKDFDNTYLFEENYVENTLLDILSQNNKTIFSIAETEKYAHVTYFFKGMKEKQLDNETTLMIPSLKLKSYADNPEMSAKKITTALIKSLQNDPCSFYLINYANADIVGHSGNLQATIKACEVIDQELKKLYAEVITKQQGTLIITGDHGNAEEPNTHHTTNPVPFIIINNHKLNRGDYDLSNIAPTILKIFRLHIPDDMSEPMI